MEYENGPLHDNICIGQYGVSTLKPERDIMKQTGSSDGWFADWLCEKWDWFNQCAADMSDCGSSSYDNGNREYLDFTFPFAIEMTQIRLQGIREIITGGYACDKNSYGKPDVPIPPLEEIGASLPCPDITQTSLPLRSRIDKFEVWCNDGNNWLVVDKDKKWNKASEVVHFCNSKDKAKDEEPYEKVFKFETHLNNFYSIAEIDLPRGQKCLEARVVFNKYTGTALGTKIGIKVVDPDSRVCRI